MTDDVRTALISYLTGLADDEFILGHRDSEWTGQGPIIEEDIAFSSMAQDELGHALGILELVETLGGPDPDTNAFRRSAEDYRNSILTELPRGDYGFSLMRRFLYDAAESERLRRLAASSHEQLAQLASKMLQEERYHWMHAVSMVKRLATGTEASRIRMQMALEECFPYALGMFEHVPAHDVLVAEGIAPSEAAVRAGWLATVCPMLADFELHVPAVIEDGAWQPTMEPVHGGRTGKHTEHLTAILDAAQMLVRADPDATW
jgi:ring-1,2-phenylacetyl-CoA epoxidase subunit PaaC